VVGDDGIAISGVNSLNEAGPGEICFFADQRLSEELKKTRGSAVIVSVENQLFNGPQVVAANPELAFARVATLLSPAIAGYPGVSERAVVHESSVIGRNVSIYPLVYVGKEAVIGDDVILFPGVFVGDRARIGVRTVIHPNVAVLRDCVIGKDVIIHAGTVIGADGFGFVRDGRTSVKIPQTGIVQIDDQVEIGANNCIDRATFGRTWIGSRVKTDNLVQIGHNVVIGDDTVVVAQAGIAGSTRIGRGVMIGPQSGLIDHLEIGDGAMIAGRSGVAKAVGAGEIVSGVPAMPHRLWLKITGLIKRLPRLDERVRSLEKKVKELEKLVEME